MNWINDVPFSKKRDLEEKRVDKVKVWLLSYVQFIAIDQKIVAKLEKERKHERPSSKKKNKLTYIHLTHQMQELYLDILP